MADQFDYVANPHEEARKATGPATTHNIHKRVVAKLGPVQRFNARLGLAITNSVGTMWAAYAFLALTLVSLPAALASQNVLIIVAWVAQTFLQLVLLPIIIVGQNIQAKAADERAIATYEDADAILHDAKQIQRHLDAQDQALESLINQVAALEKKLLAAEKKSKTK